MKGDTILLFLILFPMAGAVLSYLIGRKNKKVRDIVAVCVAAVEFIAVVTVFVMVCQGKTYSFYLPDFCLMGLYLELDGFRALYGLIAAFMWFVTTVFSTDYQKHHHNRNDIFDGPNRLDVAGKGISALDDVSTESLKTEKERK